MVMRAPNSGSSFSHESQLTYMVLSPQPNGKLEVFGVSPRVYFVEEEKLRSP